MAHPPPDEAPMKQVETPSKLAVITAGRRAQAVRVWAATLSIVTFWIVAILAAPTARLANVDEISEPLFKFFGYICHQMPDRSFHIMGEQFGVCSRCFGVYFGIVLGVAFYPLFRVIDSVEPLARIWLFLSLIPIGIDWSLTAFGIWENTQLSRLVTGLILGIACAVFIMPALVEIIRNITHRRNAAAPYFEGRGK